MNDSADGSGFRRRLRHPGVWPVTGFLAVVLVALHLMSSAVQNSDELSRVFVPLLAVVLVGLLGLGVLLVVNLVRLVRRYRAQAAGSRLTGRMVLLFAVIALVLVSLLMLTAIGCQWARFSEAWEGPQAGVTKNAPATDGRFRYVPIGTGQWVDAAGKEHVGMVYARVDGK